MRNWLFLIGENPTQIGNWPVQCGNEHINENPGLPNSVDEAVNLEDAGLSLRFPPSNSDSSSVMLPLNGRLLALDAETLWFQTYSSTTAPIHARRKVETADIQRALTASGAARFNEMLQQIMTQSEMFAPNCSTGHPVPRAGAFVRSP